MATPLPATLAIEKFNADLRDIQRGTEKELIKELRALGNEARDKVRSSTARPFRTGRTRRGIKTSVRRKVEVSLYSLDPQAPVWNWGGTIKPRGTPITFPRTEFVSGVVEKEGADFDERIAERFDEIAHRNGFWG